MSVDEIGQGAKGLGHLFLENKFEITDEEMDDRAHESVYGGGDVAWDSLTKQMVHASCAFFAQETLTGPPEPPYNGHFIINEHHEEWDELVSNFDRICVLAPRDHGKTFFFDFAYPIWQAVRIPDGSGFIFSATQLQASEILDDIKLEIETNPKLQYLLPNRKDGGAWSRTHIRLSNGHDIYARGFGTRVRGAHPNWIIVDDGLNDETIYSELVRNKQKDYFFTAITNMIIPGGQIIVVGTPFHKDDLYAALSKNSEYAFRKYQAEKDPVNKIALWPDRYPWERLQARKREIGGIRYTREFMTDPIADEMSLFPLKLFKGDPVEQFNVKLGMPLEYWQAAGVTPFVGVDFAISSSVEADYTIVWNMGTDRYGNRWIINIRRAKGLAYQEQLSMINTEGRLYEPALIYLEDNQMQSIFGMELIRLTDLPIKGFTTGVQKHSLEKGVPSLRVLLENGKFRIPRGDKHSVEMTDLWIEEMRSFTWQDGKLQSVGGHDDMVMACWICDQAIRHGGFQFSFGDEYEDDEISMDDLVKEMTGEAEEEAELRAEEKAEDGDDILEGPGVIPDMRPALESVSRKRTPVLEKPPKHPDQAMTPEELLAEVTRKQLGVSPTRNPSLVDPDMPEGHLLPGGDDW